MLLLSRGCEISAVQKQAGVVVLRFGFALLLPCVPTTSASIILSGLLVIKIIHTLFTFIQQLLVFFTLFICRNYVIVGKNFRGWRSRNYLIRHKKYCQLAPKIMWVSKNMEVVETILVHSYHIPVYYVMHHIKYVLSYP